MKLKKSEIREEKVQAAIPQAREYVDRQMETMTRSGHAANLSPERYEETVRRMAEITVKARGGW